ncbi:uncharacterized protein LOC108855255 isoform X1 [Raphanus sativus]|uniref:Uncharacterized protein LOC108855255 isoform X1 n=1 Tax=Raphanus sativus TaxID=3726 RepID=A0A6J0NIZ0_RAPSA|nr:uncharacterized protein LOC108855255 isoform X1 [Raphanus sativus]XP_056865202.1 uncharacterized protein LOC108855255 isoform X1 [Raphanus sativus]
MLRHNLDVMHIEKNVFDNLAYTLLDDKKKSKDNLNARKDLRELGIRSELWPDDNGKYQAASFSLTSQGKETFLSVLKDVRLSDGYASNLSSCADVDGRKLSGLKSHDCHVIMRDLLSVAILNVLPTDVTLAIVEICQFFRDISAKVLDIEELDKLQDRIVVTLCRMEMLFPPSFFTVMVHLIVHLTEEAKFGGPVPYRWMYPIERTLGHFKSYVRNRAKPEGSICEQYLADECITFCSMYLNDIETRFTRVSRADDRPLAETSIRPNSELPLIFPNIGRFIGAGRVYSLNHIERQQAHRHILVNCQLLDHLRKKYKNELLAEQSHQSKRNRAIDIDREMHLNFAKWIKKKVEMNELEEITDDLRCLALGPSKKVVKYTAYNVNGFKFRTVEREAELKTQNSGVYVAAETMSYASARDCNPRTGTVAYYGNLIEVIELNYYEVFKVVLFKCKWADTRTERGYKIDVYGHHRVNFSRLLHSGDNEEDEPYILASQVRMVYYVNDPSEKEWKIAVHVQPRDLYDMGDSNASDQVGEESDPGISVST